MVKARTKKEFENIWECHIRNITLLVWSLPEEKRGEFCKLVLQLLGYVKIASKNVYGE